MEDQLTVNIKFDKSLVFTKHDPKDWKQFSIMSGIYILIGDNNVYLYVGQAVELKNRLREHVNGYNKSKRFYKEIRTVYYAEVEVGEEERLIIESALRIKLRPKYNTTDKKRLNSMANGERYVSKEVFNLIKDELAKGVIHMELAKRFDVSISTISLIRNLKLSKYREWEEERLQQLATV